MQNLIYGKHAVIRFLENHPNMVIKVYTSHAKDLLASGLVDEPQVTSSTNDKLAKMFNEPVNHQGYVASVKEFNYTPFKEMLNELAVLPTAGVLILDQIHDPYNFGAMIRSALLNNVKHIIILERKQVPVNATVVKTSAGTVYGAKIAKVTNLNQAMKELQNLGFWMYASNLNASAQNLHEVKFAEKSALLIGNEQKGLGELVTKNSDVNVFIPSSQIIDSYNASVAAGILLYTLSSQLKLI